MTFQLPATMQVFERGWLSSNNILFNGPATALVDSGYLTHAPQTLALVRHALGGRPLDRLLNTHLHSDHCGGNALLQASYACHTAIPAAEAAKVACWDEDALSYRATGQQCARFSFDAVLAPGDSLTLGGMCWNVLAAPGHDPHALLLFCASHGILIAGDALWENGFGVIFPELAGEPGFDEARATLDLIATLDARAVIPGHGRMFTDVDGALARAYSRLDYLASDPRRNAENAVKVMVKFLLLERQRIALLELPGLLASIPVVGSAMRLMGVDAFANVLELVERVSGRAAHPRSQRMPDGEGDRIETPAQTRMSHSGGDHIEPSAQTRRVGGPPAHAFNEPKNATSLLASDPYASLANWAIASLVRARAARIDADYLVDA